MFRESFFIQFHRVADRDIPYNKIIDISYLARIHLNLVSSWNSMIFPISRGNIRRKKERKVFELMAGLQPNKKTHVNKIEKDKKNYKLMQPRNGSHRHMGYQGIHDCVNYSNRTEPSWELWLKLSQRRLLNGWKCKYSQNNFEKKYIIATTFFATAK